MTYVWPQSGVTVRTPAVAVSGAPDGRGAARWLHSAFLPLPAGRLGGTPLVLEVWPLLVAERHQRLRQREAALCISVAAVSVVHVFVGVALASCHLLPAACSAMPGPNHEAHSTIEATTAPAWPCSWQQRHSLVLAARSLGSTLYSLVDGHIAKRAEQAVHDLLPVAVPGGCLFNILFCQLWLLPHLADVTASNGGCTLQFPTCPVRSSGSRRRPALPAATPAWRHCTWHRQRTRHLRTCCWVGYAPCVCTV